MLNHKNLQKIFVGRGCSQLENCQHQLMDQVGHFETTEIIVRSRQF